MKSRRLLAIVVAVFGVVLAFGLSACSGSNNSSSDSSSSNSSSTSSSNTGAVAATVNGNDISEDDITNYIQGFRENQGLTDEDSWGQWLAQYQMTPESVRSAVLQQFERTELLNEAANEYGVNVTDEDVDSNIQRMRSNYDSDDAWNQALSQAGYTEDTYRQTVRSGLQQRGLMEQVNTGVQDPSDDDVLNIAKQYGSAFNGAKRSEHILFSSDNQDQAQQVLDQINNGQISFEDAASQYSIDTQTAQNGGDVGWDKLNQFNSDYTSQLDSLSPGQVSGLFNDQYGIEIVKCTDQWNAPDSIDSLDQMPSELVDFIRQMLISENQQQAFSNWFSNYRNNASIQENDMPDGLPYNVDMSKYQTDNSSTSDQSQNSDSQDQSSDQNNQSTDQSSQNQNSDQSGQSSDQGQSSQDSGSNN